MNQKLDLLQNLIENNSIRISCVANDWKEAIRECINPLIDAKVVNENYIDEIIDSVNQNGPYFIIANDVAMPHAQGKSCVFQMGFSLITLSHPVYFEKDDRSVSILIGLASNSPDIHVAIALPQIAAILEDQKNIELIKGAKTKEEIIEIIQKVDLKKYLE